ncbi:MAG: uroporphyrinogen-III synthase [Acidimicrobiales bacterium]
MNAHSDHADLEKVPLLSKSVVVTRSPSQAPELISVLAERGARPVPIPVIDFIAPTDAGRVEAAATSLEDYDWLVVTSSNGVERFCSALSPTQAFERVKVAAIGPGTVAALERFDVVADLVPTRFVAEGLLDSFPDPPLSGGRVLLARAEQARQVLPEGLRKLGWEVDDVAVYRTIAVEVSAVQREQLASADVVTFTSSSTVRNLVDQVGLGPLPSVVATISPVTSATARALGLEVNVEATEHTIGGLVSALERHFGADR